MPNSTRVYTRRPIADRLFEKLEPRESGCVEFVGASCNGGYGVIHAPGAYGVLTTHRVAWELAHGPVPPGMDLCHMCDNPPCCNVDHMFLGTRRDNVRDMWSKGREFEPPRRYGIEHHAAYVPDDVVRECREEYAAGVPYRQIAESRDLNHYTVWGWVKGKGRVAAGGPIAR